METCAPLKTSVRYRQTLLYQLHQVKAYVTRRRFLITYFHLPHYYDRCCISFSISYGIKRIFFRKQVVVKPAKELTAGALTQTKQFSS